LRVDLSLDLRADMLTLLAATLDQLEPGEQIYLYARPALKTTYETLGQLADTRRMINQEFGN
jgi:hypothetical protein